MIKIKKLREYLINEFADNTLRINDEQFVSIELFESALYNIALNDAVIGILASRLGNIEIKEDDIVKYMSEYTNDVEVKFQDGFYIIKRK